MGIHVYKLSLNYPNIKKLLGNENKQYIIHCNLSKMKNRILPTWLQGNYKDSLGESSNTSYDVCWGWEG